ncbi:MAG: acyltransferase [Candidatus Eremiobacteraeota bacterium]|nr:acyltransferase [Candidatus Eremiobacteraeota bacterium]MBC5827122.1 acyltransferase [Candidatus Eremiobacteraeota bacterium]
MSLRRPVWSFASALSTFFSAARQTKTERELRARFPDIQLGEGVIVKGAHRLFAGRALLLDVRAYLNCAGGDWSNNSGFIRAGDNVEIGPYSVLWGAGGITLGNDVHIGAHVSITAHEAKQVAPENQDVFKPLEMEFDPVIIEDHVLVCSGAVIIPGVTIGHHAMIGGGAVVTRDIPPYGLAVGCPARVIRYSNSQPQTAGAIS